MSRMLEARVLSDRTTNTLGGAVCRDTAVRLIPPDGFTFARAELELEVRPDGSAVILSKLMKKT